MAILLLGPRNPLRKALAEEVRNLGLKTLTLKDDILEEERNGVIRIFCFTDVMEPGGTDTVLAKCQDLMERGAKIRTVVIGFEGGALKRRDTKEMTDEIWNASIEQAYGKAPPFHNLNFTS